MNRTTALTLLASAIAGVLSGVIFGVFDVLAEVADERDDAREKLGRLEALAAASAIAAKRPAKGETE